MSNSTGSTEKAELEAFQHWKDPGLAARGFERWRELRRVAPRAFLSNAQNPGRGDRKLWYLLTYEDMRAVYRDPEQFSSSDWVSSDQAMQELIPASLDPPRHGKYRKALLPPFSPRAIDQREPRVREFCRTLVEKIAQQSECDFMTQFALQFPTGVFVEMMGLPLAELDRYIDIIRRINQTPPDHVDFGTIVGAAEKECIAEFTRVIEERRREPAQDLISFLLSCRVDGQPFSQEELLSACVVLMRGGLDTTTAQLGHIFWHLAQDPDLRRRIREQPADIPKIVEEMMRF